VLEERQQNVYFYTFSFSFLFSFHFLDGCVNILGACTFIKSALSRDMTSTNMDTADESLAAQSIAGTNEEMKKII
jgi:hypothetical protein